jgi:hypothetical protein
MFSSQVQQVGPELMIGRTFVRTMPSNIDILRQTQSMQEITIRHVKRIHSFNACRTCSPAPIVLEESVPRAESVFVYSAKQLLCGGNGRVDGWHWKSFG